MIKLKASASSCFQQQVSLSFILHAGVAVLNFHRRLQAFLVCVVNQSSVVKLAVVLKASFAELNYT